ncbi:MAG: glycosyl hydrolase family 28-related protein, partial [Phycisphaerales bacterium]
MRSGKALSKTMLLNLPDPWWCQGNVGAAATPGGTVRFLGKNLCWSGGTSGAAAGLPAATVALGGPRSVTLAARGDCYSLTVDLPPELPLGEYQLRVHNGRGGPCAWSRPLAIKVVAPASWPTLTLNVMDFGADGRGLADDTPSIAEALARLKGAGGGVLYFPRGRYLVSETLNIPERTVLRGEKRELCAICWPDRKEPLADMMIATRSFGIEDLSFYSANYGNFLTVDLKSPEIGDVHLRRLRVVANRYRGHMYQDPKEMSDRFTRFGVHGGKLLALGGQNVEVSDCDLLSSGCALFLTRARGARIENNVFRMGRFGWFWLSGSDGVVFENNQCLGQDLSTWGGGINCLDGSSVSQHVYFARNTCAQWFGGDNEMTTDGSGGAYYGRLAAAEGTRLTTADEPKWGKRDWRGAAVLVIGGRGVGQCRRVVRTEGRKIEIDRPWDVVPGADSQVTITMYQGDYLLVENRFADIGVIQFYGMSLGHLCAGNTSARTAGFFNMGMNYHHIQPSWHIQWL